MLILCSAKDNACRTRPLMKWAGVWKKKHLCCKVANRSISSRVARAACSRRSSGEAASGCDGGRSVAGGACALAIGVLELVESVLDVDEFVEELLLVGEAGGSEGCWTSGLLRCVGLASAAGGVGGWSVGGAGRGWRQRSATVAAYAACRSPRKFWSKASCAVAGT